MRTLNKTFRFAAVVLAAAAFIPAAASAQVVYGTGVDAAGNPLPGGSADPHWTFAKQAPTLSTVSALVIDDGSLYLPGVSGGYVLNTSTAKWISTSASAFTGLGNVTYTQTFDLAPYILSTVSVGGSFAIADGFLGVYLNGTRLTNGTPAGLGDETSATQPWSYLHTFNVSAGDPLFVPGVNTLQFVSRVENDVDNGLFADLTSTGRLAPVSSVPEPATLALFATGLGIVGGIARRRRS